jgi:predicted short-subunit dehydrogenase-like oxidoreductase (DUF2520 family)
MRISFIGAGRVAYHLASVLKQQHQIVQVYSRTWEKTQRLAEHVAAQACPSLSELNPEIDLLILAVSDQSIATVIAEVAPLLPNVLIVHTSGSTDLQRLQQHHPRSGVFYPLQTFSLERELDWKQTPLFVEATTEEDQQSLLQLAQQLSERVYAYSSQQRLSLHLAAVFACNFANYCYDMSKQIVDQTQVDFSLLYPLILETARKATSNDPKNMQTGPAVRGDVNILQMHQAILADLHRPDLAEVYALISQQIMQRHQA